ncbi:ATP-binding protein [Mycobacterium lepromatosis]|uniref:ATP-binding protein n=1 Tax=Mycobacterium lepromatosis TaxID=480418 RepID=UPI000B0BAB7A
MYRSLAIASHRPFEQWERFLPEHTSSILDHLLHHATIVVTSGESYRMCHTGHEKRAAKPS